MSSSFFDGKSARVHNISLSFGGDALVFAFEGKEVKWTYNGIRLIDINLRKITHQNDKEARINLSSQDYDALLKFAPQISLESHKGNHRNLILSLTAAGIAFTSLIFFGIPLASRPLALATPPKYENGLLKSIEAQLDVAFDFCPVDNDGGRALQKLSNNIAANGDLKFDVEIGVIDMNIPNAFALPGGKIYFTQALLKEAENGDEIAGVMAHELAHIENRDVMASMYRIMGFAVLLDALVGGGSGASQQLIMLSANLTDLKNSRDAEQKADFRGLELLEKAGIDGRGLASFFLKIEKMEKGAGVGDWAEFISSHPATKSRAELASKMAKTGTAALSDSELASVKKLCGK